MDWYDMEFYGRLVSLDLLFPLFIDMLTSLLI